MSLASLEDDVQQLRSRLLAVAESCAGSGSCRMHALPLTSVKLPVGQFRTARSVTSNITPDVPRPFRMDDEPGSIDLGSLQPRPLIEQVMEGSLRCRQRMFEAELDLVIGIDASRSQLATDERHTFKPERLLRLAAATVSAACACKFKVQILVASEGTLHDRLRGNEAGRLRLPLLHSVLPDMLCAAAAQQLPRSPDTLARLIGAELRRKRRGVAIFISDFLDPAPSYLPALRQLSRTHRIVLVDMATRLDRVFPVPAWWEKNAQCVPVLEGARHLEEHLSPMPVTTAMATAWNALQAANLEALHAIEHPRRLRHLVHETFASSTLPLEQHILQALKQLS
ncbi:MAG: hypothetical protein JNJ83_24360 [Verrucomicrobiaceae bacterium]|nr:hypothetical protein [Verrucomicrobiaceae bacterium]